MVAYNFRGSDKVQFWFISLLLADIVALPWPACGPDPRPIIPCCMGPDPHPTSARCGLDLGQNNVAIWGVECN